MTQTKAGDSSTHLGGEALTGSVAEQELDDLCVVLLGGHVQRGEPILQTTSNNQLGVFGDGHYLHANSEAEKSKVPLLFFPLPNRMETLLTPKLLRETR